MLVISFEKGHLLGGYGDRMVGLINVKLMADLLKRDFYIIWTKENVKKYIDYKKYDYEEKSFNNISFRVINAIDRQSECKNLFIDSTELFNTDACTFFLNNDVSQYLYANKYYNKDNNNYLNDIYNAYSTLYTDILKPTPYSENIINALIPNNTKIMGIQIRAGDAYMKTNPGEQHRPIKNPDVTIATIFQTINDHAAQLIKDGCLIFITSDYENIYNMACNIWNSKQILYYNEPIQHLDRRNSGEFSKFYIDNYILSQKTNRLYISDYSNYGRIAALSANHSNIFSLSCKELDKKELLSKEEQIW